MMQAQTVSNKPSCSVELFPGAILCTTYSEAQGKLELAMTRWACDIERNDRQREL